MRIHRAESMGGALAQRARMTAAIGALSLAAVACGASDSDTASGDTVDADTTTVTADSAGGDAAAGKEITFVSPLIGHPVWLQAKDAFEARADELGMTPTWTGPQGVDIATMVQMLESAMASGADALVTCALDPVAFSSVLDEAVAREIPVVLTDCEAESEDQRLAFVGTIGQTFGEESGEKLAELVGGEARIIVMQGSFDAKIQNDILGGFEDAIADEAGMEIIAREADDSDVQVAIDKFSALFRTYPDATVVYCIEASCAGAAATVAEEQGLLDQLLIFGTDDTEETLDGIRNGSIEISAAQDFPAMGRLSAEYLADHFNGEEVPSITDTGVIFITEENVDNYLESSD